MFKKGDFIIYETAGTCKVTDIRTVDIDGISKERLYYVLEPLGDRGSKIMTPVDSTKSFMRKILTKDDVYRLIDEMKNIDQLGIMDDKQRKETYKAALKSCDCRAWIGIIKNLYLKKQDRTLQGKRLTEADEHFFTKAKEYLYGEMSISLGSRWKNLSPTELTRKKCSQFKEEADMVRERCRSRISQSMAPEFFFLSSFPYCMESTDSV